MTAEQWYVVFASVLLSFLGGVLLTNYILGRYKKDRRILIDLLGWCACLVVLVGLFNLIFFNEVSYV